MFQKFISKYSFSINQDYLKIYALIAMTIDHFAQIFNPPYAVEYRVFIGRTSFPVFAFLLMYHLAKKQIFKKYCTRLLFFGVLSTCLIFPFQEKSHLNVFFTFLWPVFTIYLIKQVFNEEMPRLMKYFVSFFILAFMALPSLMTAYYYPGFFYLLALYVWYLKPSFFVYILVLVLSFFANLDENLLLGVVSCFTTLVLLHVDMDKPHPRLLRKWWFFYVYYPAHLLLLYLLKMYL